MQREVVFQLVETARLVRNHVEDRARDHGTTRAQWGLLSRLRRQEGLRQAALAEQMELQPISLARLLDRLQEQGLVERRPDPSDRRAYRLHLTPAGMRLVDDLAPLRAAIAGELLADTSEAALAAGLELLSSIRERARAPREDLAAAGSGNAG